DYPLQKKKEFLNNYLKKIDVEYIIKEKSHKMNFEFKYPIVDDKLSQFGKDKDGKRTYRIEDGMKSSSYKLKLKNTYKSKVDLEDKENLNKLIYHLRVGKSLSLNQICKELNRKGFRTPTNKEWNKSILSLYIKNLKVDVGK
ncbi:recombinase family protein, partial [Flavobacteriaceae bacterium]|nr:recombinase family protein [Flavobacteriaceae bacterium]